MGFSCMMAQLTGVELREGSVARRFGWNGTQLHRMH